tara:strand:- start:42992 stop:46165 length:3174 start_codon:yes stop_codon:yes gene_type:complete
MKHMKKLLVFFIAIGLLASCEEEETSYALQEVSAPTNVKAIFDISQDDTGTVTVTPTAVGATSYQIYFGDVENETPAASAPGETLSHVYAEGEYTLRIVAVGLTGLTSELSRIVTISFSAPTELTASIEITPTNPFEITVTPSATNVTVYDIYFGDVENEEPTTIMAGEVAKHSYAEAGEYTVRIVARGAGAATTEITETVTINGAAEPITLPITFDDATVNYAFVTFNGASYEVVDNPDLTGVNTVASKVGAITNSGAAYEGGSFTLGTPVDFSGTNKTITMKFWSNVAVPLLLKFEGGVNGERQNEVSANHGGTGWEDISFDFATNATKSYIDGGQGVGEAFVPTGQYATIVLFVDGPGNTAGTFYIDDVAQDAGASNPLALPMSFDDSTVDYTFGTFNGANYDVIANPSLTGANTVASKVGAITNSGAAYEGGAFTLGTPVDFADSDKTITLKLWSDASLPILLKFEGGVNGERQNEVVVTHGGTGWENLSFDFATNATKSYIDGSQGVGEAFVPTGQYATLVIFVDGPGTTAGTFYIDDIAKGGVTGGAIDPTNGPTMPSRDQANVLSIFSDVYSDPAGVNYRPDWGQTTAYEEVDLAGDKVIKYSDINYEGIDFGGAVDVTTYDSFHIDIWSNDYTEVPFFMISSGSGEKSVLVNVVPNQWNSIEIPLVDFTSQGLTINDIIQFKLDVQPDNGGTIYLDNLYFYKDGGSTGGTGKSVFPVDFESPTGGAASLWNVFENVDNPELEIITNPDMSGANTSSTVAKFTARVGGATYAGTETPLETPFTLDASNSTVKIRVWKSFISDVGIKFANGAGGSTGEIKVPNTKTNEWEELSFDFSGVIGDPNNSAIEYLVVFPDFDARTQDNVAYFDNITLNASGSGGGTGGAAPTAAAPTPTVASANVISMFSDAYTDVSVDTWRTDWSSATLEDVMIAGNATKKYGALDFVGIETTTTTIDAAAMTHFHTDVWSSDFTSFSIKLVDFGANGVYDGGGDDVEHQINIDAPATGEWVSLDIPLADFTGLTTKGHIAQLIYVGAPTGGNTVYVDNVYFHN